MASVFFEAAFGDMSLLIANITTDDGRDIAIQSPARGDLHYLQDRGAKLGKVACEILFVDQPHKSSYLERFDEFRALVMSGTPHIFTHPLIGSYRARAEGGSHVASSEDGQIRYSCTFLPEDEPQPVFPAGAGVAPSAGVEAVVVALDLAMSDLGGIGVPTSAIGGIAATMTAWRDAADLDSQAVFVGIASMTNTINEMIEVHDLVDDLGSWGAYRSMIGLHNAVRRAGESLTSDSERVYSLLVTSATPLLRICAEVYGPEQAQERAATVARLNRVRTPGLVPAGTTLKLPVNGAP